MELKQYFISCQDSNSQDNVHKYILLKILFVNVSADILHILSK